MLEFLAYILTIVIIFAVAGMVSQETKFFKTKYQKIKNWWVIYRCKATKHRMGVWRTIESVPLGEWGEPLANRQVRSVMIKTECSRCKTIFIIDNYWEGKDSY